MTVTVCIPAYRAGTFIAQTVGAVLNQTHADLRVIVAIDPPADGSPDDTAAALAPLVADPRLCVLSNPVRLGWPENVNAFFPLIETPIFCFLPHDDIWAPTYVEALLAALNRTPQAVIAYADTLRFGAARPTRKSATFPPDCDRATGLLHFLLQGTEAHMWRGLTRTEVLDRIKSFPTDRHKGLVVECEYALALLGAGPALHVPRTLYFKRIYGHDVVSASRERMLQPVEDRHAGWTEHDRRMQDLLVQALDDMQAGASERMLCETAKEAALLRRYQQFVTPVLDDISLNRAQRALERLGSGPLDAAAIVAANLHMVLRNHWLAAGQHDKAEGATLAACEAGCTYETVLLHAQMLASQNRPLDALERATEAMRLGHRDDVNGARDLIDNLYARLGWAGWK